MRVCGCFVHCLPATLAWALRRTYVFITMAHALNKQFWWRRKKNNVILISDLNFALLPTAIANSLFVKMYFSMYYVNEAMLCLGHCIITACLIIIIPNNTNKTEWVAIFVYRHWIARQQLMIEGVISFWFFAIELIMVLIQIHLNCICCLLHPIILNILSDLILEHQGIWKMVMHQLLFFVVNRILYWGKGSAEKKFDDYYRWEV